MGVECDVAFCQYENGRTAIQLTEDGSPFAVATINDPSVDLRDGHVLIKNYSENSGMVQALHDAGVVHPLYQHPIGKFGADAWVCCLMPDSLQPSIEKEEPLYIIGNSWSR